ncbi:inosine-uridine nucleoside N-ribohydrolase [Maritalea mobilis]|uniref:Inosine-uridine nucleoside N-ribohydrolase n=1 Tax=Maritalea mobilis TaxID=483324 RepID=A0A4R6W1S7_9HYPH|nr:nucleoside hydrolase [Maritalea mobilis]TDQ66905.1 inosine-uridine nucleoside N-ribohydrolase [Maritalea mobilis]
MSQHKIILDTDPGIDDAMAIHHIYADPRIELLGMTTIFGNVPVTTATRNALHLAEMVGAKTPVAEGAKVPLVQTPNPHADFVHGVEGFGDYPRTNPKTEKDPRSAAEFLCEMTAAQPGEITICAVGPLTNLALALEHDPAIAKNVKNVVIMGGAVDAPGNVTEFAEANIWNDPHAAQKVFDAEWDVTLVGLDVTQKIVCTLDDFAKVSESSPEIGKFLSQISTYYINFYVNNVGLQGCALHDPAAIIALTDPELFTTKHVPLNTIPDGNEVGNTVELADGNRRVHVCSAADSEGVRKVFLDTLANADARKAARQ